MLSFSKRNKYDETIMTIENVSETLKNRILATFYKEEFHNDTAFYHEVKLSSVEELMIEMGILYKYPSNSFHRDENWNLLKDTVLSGEWYLIFDFIEKYLTICNHDTVNKMSSEFNRILEEELSAYRIVDSKIVPIVNEVELNAITIAKQSKFDSVNQHISKALDLFSNRKQPDFENSIKESLCAVESLCSIITGKTGADVTLGNMLKHLSDSGVHIHQALINGFKSFYGFASDESGIRHGSIDFKGASREDALFMLVSCSAFVNYLIEKQSKIESTR